MKFEERTCEHPNCNMKFKVLKTSDQKFHSLNCKISCGQANSMQLVIRGFFPRKPKAKDV